MKGRWMFAGVWVVCCLGGCATPPDAYRKIDAAVGVGGFEAALQAVEDSPAYPAKNEILRRLDRGLLLHYAREWADSSAELEAADRLIEEAYTKSVSEEIGTYLLNDNTRSYAGEDYEDVYLDVFNALNYYHGGFSEDAMVEVRRMNEKLAFLGVKYAKEIARVEDYAVKNGAKGAAKGGAKGAPALPFTNSALGNYLGLLFYRAGGPGEAGNARVSAEGLESAYRAAPEVYPFEAPRSLAGELAVPAGMARLNLLAFAGLSPVKREEVTDFPFVGPSTGYYIPLKLSLPVMAERRTIIDKIEAVVENEGGGEPERVAFELLEDMAAVARATFRQREALIALKTTVRATVRLVAADAVAKALIDQGSPAILAMAGVIALTRVSEQADTRMARYFPGRAYIGAVNLPPGAYRVTVNYYAGGRLAASEHREVVARAGALNLVETVSLK